MSVFAIYVEKKKEYAMEAASVLSDLQLGLQLENIKNVRIINRYYAENISEEDFNKVRNTIFHEPPVDKCYDTMPDLKDAFVFAVEYLPGQFDQRADSCAQCISLATGKERPNISSSKIYAVYGDFTEDAFNKIKSWLINPVESREASLIKPLTLMLTYPRPLDVGVINGFITFSLPELEKLHKDMNLAMDLSDLLFCQKYFKNEEKRDPTITEIKVLDTYWSDHCRHTTFLTELKDILIEDDVISCSYANYLNLRASLGRNQKPVTLMDIATIGAAALKRKGLLSNLDESPEINTCSVKIKVDIDGEDHDWLLMFKNETHNHPTEIEPFGGAATCLGGAIRDPLSGRSFVYQAMRLTGASTPLRSANDTLPGKLPQRKICRTAAAGYSSYGNQIGLATGLVHEIYHPGYEAKRMEIGAVIGAAPAENVIRNTPEPFDAVILLGGRTGRDGIGGATGSSKSHTETSLFTCGADVQKGNAPEERKIQRLLRDPSVTRMIKRCNDFGAGGVCVSAGELADGLVIDLDKILKKYEGLDGTELAISESQERMSLVVSKDDVSAFIKSAGNENLEATVIAEVIEEKRLIMKWRGKTIVNLSRNFVNSNGETRSKNVHVKKINDTTSRAVSQRSELKTESDLLKFAGSLNICSRKGLSDMFDFSVGAAAAVSPYGGKYQLTPTQGMAAKIPVLKGETKTCSLMTWGFDPEISEKNPYYGAVFSVVHSVAKIVAMGGSRKSAYLTFQEYFERLRDDPSRWAKPFAALLGALDAQLGLQVAAIGGKDSMSGSFTKNDGTEINVPPTLVSFAVSTQKIENIITPEFKKAGNNVYLLKPPEAFISNYDFDSLCKYFDIIETLINQGVIISAWAAGQGGTAEAVLKMCFGNRLGFYSDSDLFSSSGFSGIVAEIQGGLTLKSDELEIERIGKTTDAYLLKTKSIEMLFYQIQHAWEKTLQPVYPYLIKQEGVTETFNYKNDDIPRKSINIKNEKHSKPKFLIPVFPGTNSEYDSAKAVEKAGGTAEIFVIRNLTPDDINSSVKNFCKALSSSRILFIPGGFSGGDEPDGSGKFITAFTRNPDVTLAVMDLLNKRDGLILGICNGFQALIKLGLVPYGEIRDMTDDSPALTYNAIGRHQSVLVNTRIVSNKSPWLCHLRQGEQFIVPVSHGEGRFTADISLIRALETSGQIATQYADYEGNASRDIRFNPNNSDYSIEGITSPDGRVFGRMAHNERFDEGLYKNIQGIKKMDIFRGAVTYFK
ncbi:MAG: phosphoribosylformylglycinamidine synthase [Treponema sp.]|nr:phosphoribosylformylglycinamidine synthase [Treponema sp.]